ncbi:Pre-rRNA-processing protein IPI1 [Cyberlindnera fabianii]|uniref:Pre-rRNA-processing protein n=1 Tax=Cyberlindnera fabianii TaxID=36022 RepID=A0A1V2L317_CYBFA|nr:Pre-rRNA-processing protein IPI1 [Cyberlindnera fabianii]
MGSSSKKKKDKQKDFRKTKLKVGKEKAKPTNFTDTSFTAKTISLPNQSISRNVEGEADIIKRLTLVKHHQNTTRKETLIYIEQHLPENPSLYKQILTAVIPLMVDVSASVRTALVNLLVAAAKKQPNLMELHARSVVLFVHSAMTHITPAIRHDSTRFLDILIEYSPDSLVRSAWVKTLRAFFTLMSWTLTDSKQSVSLAVTTSSVINTSSKAKKQTLDSFAKFIKAGCRPSEAETRKKLAITSHPLTQKYLIPVTPQPFAHLKLFTRELTNNSGKAADTGDKTLDLNTVACEDYLTRRRVFVEFFAPHVLKNVENIIKEGGEAGKAAKTLQVLVEEVVKEHEDQDKQQ